MYTCLKCTQFLKINAGYSFSVSTNHCTLEMYRMPKVRYPRMRMHMRISVHEESKIRGRGCTFKHQRMEICGCKCRCQYLEYYKYHE